MTCNCNAFYNKEFSWKIGIPKSIFFIQVDKMLSNYSGYYKSELDLILEMHKLGYKNIQIARTIDDIRKFVGRSGNYSEKCKGCGKPVIKRTTERAIEFQIEKLSKSKNTS